MHGSRALPLSLQSWHHLLPTTAQDGRVAVLSPLLLLPSTSVLIPNPQIPPRGKCIVCFPLSQEYPSNTKVTGLEIPSFSNKPLLFKQGCFFPNLASSPTLIPKEWGKNALPFVPQRRAFFISCLSGCGEQGRDTQLICFKTFPALLQLMKNRATVHCLGII